MCLPAYTSHELGQKILTRSIWVVNISIYNFSNIRMMFSNKVNIFHTLQMIVKFENYHKKINIKENKNDWKQKRFRNLW